MKLIRIGKVETYFWQSCRKDTVFCTSVASVSNLIIRKIIRMDL